jgi:hypothetical protein
MIRDIASSALLCSILGAAALASPVSDFRDGMDASFDLIGATITSTGAAEIDEVIEDSQGAPFCAPKARGTLNIDIDLLNLGFPGSIPVTLVGTELSPTRVRWDASIDVNQCLDTTLPDGTPISVLIREVVVRMTGELSPTGAFTEEYCVARRGVQIQTVGGDADNFIDVTAYALCVQFPFTRIDIDVRTIDAQGRGGDDPCPADTNGDNIVNFADLNAVLGQFGLQSAPAELVGDVNLDGAVNFGDLNAVLAAFGAVCGI